ncbi:Aminoglycoside phosphotransferase [Penicillium cf. griseofulvum]|uniref:Aminoglycoside phosphotransferase n=1 Tax=Penicillium cf. griseofulvum TaxID=2972120 RepID=A0A9W9M3D2_9EURO|nr:Aminoglycoside phosphotransferase [Penicillium cf. griseofulvum]KAJ5422897.1 Aminoglycoside phosphotransferase [Penicillium cf. griseofulvum]KAJ5433886.1 Aminoglycoside phosphotransferase [Penicillium cf. griseofulvum]
MGHLSQSFSERLRRIAEAIISFSSSILDHVTLKRLRGNDDSDDDEDDDLDSLDIDPFEAVLKRVKVKHIGKYVAAIRANTQSSDKKIIPVIEVGSPSCNGEHMCFRVKFADGVSWLLKVPAIGTPDQFDEGDAETLRSEFPSDARHLDDVWHGRESPKEVVQARRTRCLQDIAAAYVQLGKYTFKESGPLRFDDKYCPIGVVPVKRDPFSGLREGYTSHLDRWGEQESEYTRGAVKLLRMFVDWAPKPSSGESFVLSHPNPNIFNFFVSEDGSVKAILGWHRTYADSPSIGNEAYPLWQMRDWVPRLYIWSEEMKQGIHDERYVWEDSPDTLEFYRNVYAQCIANLLPESENAKVTRNPILFRHLGMAGGDSMFGIGLAEKIFSEVMKRMEKNVDDNSQPASCNSSKNNEKVNDSQYLSSAKEKDATCNHNSTNESEVKPEHGGIEADNGGEDEDEFFDVDGFLKNLDRNGLSEHRQKLFRAGFEALFTR